MSSDLGNMLRILQVLRDEGFVDALTDVERLVADVDERLEHVEQVENDAERAVRDAEAALDAVDDRLEQFDEMISLLEAKIEAAFSIGFFFFAIDRWTADDPFLALGLLFMGLLGASSLAVTVRRLPQVRRLRTVGRYATNRLDSTDDWLDDEEDEGKSK
ncbi:hypothetical protein GJ631_08295 [Natronomonas sp. CBA1123]|uniref:hypothetical protein n=1 Tax=Natronomonas sp. CBA1123 TaxID=2668070 RepID=UPI0012EA1864|nr:hypothetical protein [Natronomonas sp. CBA1123]MUV86566.1 hypothetical protein [Natronomonas sp. CBA1123]